MSIWGIANDLFLSAMISLCGLGILWVLRGLFKPFGPPLVSVGEAFDGEVDGSSDGGEPDALTEQLARRIDGPDAAVVGRLMGALADAESVLGCGCLDVAWPQHACPRCDWRTCLGHAGAHHYCVGDELPRRGAPLPAAVEASVNDAFAAIINRSNVGDLKHTDADLARFYLIGDEK